MCSAADIAASADELSANVTKPKPLDLRVEGSLITTASDTAPYFLKNALNLSSVVSKLSPPMKSLLYGMNGELFKKKRSYDFGDDLEKNTESRRGEKLKYIPRLNSIPS